MADRLAPAIQRLLADIPLRSRVLGIGCGTGTFARELATKRGARVTAIDDTPRMIDVARVRTRASLGIDYRVASFSAVSPSGFDVVVAIDTGLSLTDTAKRMADSVRPGGRVVISDRFAARGIVELPYNAVSWLLRCSRADGEHLPLHVIRSTLRRVLPGVNLRRHLDWRYTAWWQKR